MQDKLKQGNSAFRGVNTEKFYLKNKRVLTTAKEMNILNGVNGTTTDVNELLDYQFGDTGAGNYSQFESDGTLVSNGDATVWKDINISGIALTRANSNQPDKVTIDTTNILTYAFGSTGLEEAHGGFELQHDYKEGTNLVPHAHFYTTTVGSGDFKIFVDYWISKEGTTTYSGTTSAVVSTNSTAWEQFRFNFDNEIDGTNLEIASQIHFRIYRDGGDAQDTYSADVALGTFGIHYEIDTLGSRGITTK